MDDMEMEWNCVRTQADVNRLNELFGNFHDSCLKELCFSTGGFVSETGAMNVVGCPVARLLFQRQENKPSVIELEFANVVQINIKPVDENQGVDIICAHLYFEDGIFFWSEKDYEYHEKGKDGSTWIAAKAVRWRVRESALGSEMVYMGDSLS